MWYIYTMEYYSATKRNKIGSFVEMWMDLETVIQSEVKSEREKQILYINAYIFGIQKNGIDDLICKAEVETQREKTYGYQGRGGGKELGEWD